MESISNTDRAVIDFLIRNFSELLTVRQIAIKLKLSPAGVHKSLKKLEKEDILNSEKLGTGLFFRINFESKIAKHLCSIVLLGDKPEKDAIDFKEAEHYVRICIHDSKSAIIVSHDVSSIKENIPKDITKKQLSHDVMTQEDFNTKVQNRDRKVIDMIKTGKVALGEEVLFNTLKRGAFRI